MSSQGNGKLSARLGGAALVATGTPLPLPLPPPPLHAAVAAAQAPRGATLLLWRPGAP